MRKTVFKRELYELEQKIGNPAVYEVIENSIFQDSYKDRGNRLFFIGEEITSIGKLVEKLKEIQGLDPSFHKEIIEILTIDDDLSIPPDLKEAIYKENVVLFIGAGVSKSLGYPTWQDLSYKAIMLLSQKGYINNFEKDRLFQISDPKEVLTIFDKICPRNKEIGRLFYEDIFKTNKEEQKHNNEQNIYDLIVKKEFSWQFITTNIDLEIIQALARAQSTAPSINKDASDNSTSNTVTFDKAYNKCLESVSIINVNTKLGATNEKSNVIYLHGIVDDVSTSIFTTKDYLKTYFNGNSEVKNVLKKIFQNKTVLFIGYGLSEFAILESIIDIDDTIVPKRHYSLYPTFHSDVHTLKIKQKAFEELNIELIPYYIDFNGFDRLYEVMNNWHNIIKKEKGDDFFDKRNFINDIL